MKAMKIGDLAFFYHSNEGKEIVGVVTISKEFYPDAKDETGKFGMVDVTAVEKLPTPVTLAQIKADPKLSEMVLVKNSRLSVQPVTPEEWAYIAKLGGLKG
jgi:predicted RNA-binding protein with PUA-like domain